MHFFDVVVLVAKSITLFSAASIVGLIAQIDTSIWEKSAWVIMCSLFLAGLTTLWRTNQKILNDRNIADSLELVKLREENISLRRQIHEGSHDG